MSSAITVPVRIDAKTFRRFSRFDMFTLRRRWVRPAVFSLMMLAFAFAALLTRKPQSGMIAAVLLVVGLGLPIVYIGTFLSQVNMQAEQLRLGKGRRVYTVKLDFDGVHVANDIKEEPPVHVKWADMKAAYRVKGCIYIYAAVTRAFLLPSGQADVPDEEVWQYLNEHMGDRCHDRGPKR